MRKAWLVATLALISLWVVAWIQTAHSDALSTELLRRSTPAGIILEEPDMAVLTTTWKYKPEPEGPCLTHTVTTNQQSGETPEEHTARHAQLVRLALIEHPAVPESSCP